MNQDLSFGVFDHLDRGGRTITALYAERLELVEQYDRAGFYAYHLAEHHSTPLGMAPSPSVFLSAVAQRTTRLRFGPLVYLLPLYHPLRLAEEIAMLDHLSQGRLEVGIGRGRSPIELMLYGQDATTAQGVFNETLAVIARAFTQDRVDFVGKHFSFQNVPIELKPLQQPHPPYWYGLGTPDSAEDYGRRGFHGVTLAKPDAAADIARRFFAGAARGGWHDRRLGICRFIVAAETDREAEAIAARAYPVWHQSFFELFRRYGQKPVQTSWAASFAEMQAMGLAFAGSPRTLAAALGAQLEAVGANYLVGQFVFGDMSLAESRNSIALFGAEVMPVLKGAER
ncbi:MAG TPA: LLM class flavin-dependent oxidoreductase [Stellaceae bacterium]|jgi:alkanesulfonate monooxygenase SsuD/methylene tetrahydromethanopterin reductase-like flavin-dependent oxidoreductase (luciferase family)